MSKQLKEIRNLSQLNPGSKGYISGIDGDEKWRQHLMNLGFVEGTEIEMIKKAPLGDPMEVKLRGYTIAFRKIDAKKILLRQAP